MSQAGGEFSARQITLAHGGGGRAMRDLIEGVLVPAFENPDMDHLEDQARLTLAGARLAFTTDSYVVDPLEFPGGNIGDLAVNGTVNDLAVGGAQPLWLSCAMIIEEGLETELLHRIVTTMRAAADEAGVRIVTGDTKVVNRGAADRLFVTTAGVGMLPQGLNLSVRNAQPGDSVIVNGYIGDHGATIMVARDDLALETGLKSDTAALNGLMSVLLRAAPGTRCTRDVTRGGLAAVVNEIAAASACRIELDEASLPVRDAVRGVCEILGLDPLYFANEGVLAAIVPPAEAQAALDAMRAHPLGRDARIVGQCRAAERPQVVLNTSFGGARVVDMLVGEQLPRIC